MEADQTKDCRIAADIITFHFPYNCGAVLQCFALQTVLEQKNCTAQVINYVPWYHRNRYTPFKNPFQFAAQWSEKTTGAKKVIKWLKGFARAIYSWRHFPNFLLREKACYGFVNHRLHLTRKYRTLEQLATMPPQADLYVTGSDQLWNAHITGGFDAAYFLPFGTENTRRISYAVGADFTEAPDSAETLPKLLERMDAISLRETKCWDAVKAAVKPETPMCVCVDPTLLLPREAYEVIEEKPQNAPKRFILTYMMPNRSANAVIAAAKKLSEKLGVLAVDVNGNPLALNRRIKDNRICSPGEFLWYIHHADYVLTNSFHGTVFSVIYEKQFVTVPHSNFGNRTSELLQKLRLEERLVPTNVEALAVIEQPIRFEGAREALSLLRAESLAYLDENIAAAEKGQTDRDGE